MTREDFNCVTKRIVDKLIQVPPPASERCIFKVPGWLRMVNEMVYEPVTVAIGPYHRGKEHLNSMEELKPRYLLTLLRRSKDITVSEIVENMRMEEQRARNCYAEIVRLDEDEFVEMLVLDGCFVVELLYRLCYGDNVPANRIFTDLFLLENQLPFFIIVKLLHIFFPDQNNMLIEAIFGIFESFVPGQGYAVPHEYTSEMVERSNHLPALIYENWLPPQTRKGPYERLVEGSGSPMRCAKELRESGIEFRKVEGRNIFDIKFRKGVMDIPVIQITDRTEIEFRNLIAYEQISDRTPKLVAEYVIFMDSLINSAKDVELLRRRGIIDNYTSDDETVSTLFNQLGKNVICDSNDRYANIVKEVNEHCNSKQM